MADLATQKSIIVNSTIDEQKFAAATHDMGDIWEEYVTRYEEVPNLLNDWSNRASGYPEPLQERMKQFFESLVKVRKLKEAYSTVPLDMDYTRFFQDVGYPARALLAHILVARTGSNETKLDISNINNEADDMKSELGFGILSSEGKWRLDLDNVMGSILEGKLRVTYKSGGNL